MLESDSRQLEDSDFNSKNSNSVQAWSSTIQILLPIAALAFIWGRRGLVTRFFLQFDKNCISAICPSLKEKEKLLQWIDWHLPVTWLHNKNSALDNPTHFWTDGSLLCDLINTYIPGACPNPKSHRHHPPSHGQALAYKYLGIAPIFTDQDLEQETFSPHQELALVQYLEKIRESCTKESKPDLKYSSNYVAKGMGLFSGEENRKMTFYIYVNSFDYFNVDDVIISIQAPSGVYETLRIPSKFIKQKLLFSNKFAYQSHSETLLLKPISDLSTSAEPQGNGHQRKMPMTFSVEEDRVKVTYIPRTAGSHEVSIITGGCHVLGSPFAVSILQNLSGVYEDIELNSLPTVAVRKTIKRTILSQTIDLLDHELVSDPDASRKVNHVVEEHIEMNYNVTKSLQANETSPICEDHIEYEVATNHKSSLIPQRNPEKIVLDNDDSISTPNMRDSVDEKRIPSPSKTEIEYENGTRENALNILNYLPHLKYDRSVSCNELSTSLEQSLSLMDDDDCFEFKKKLSFWKDRSNFGTIKNKLKQRRSLPDLLLGNASGELFDSYDKSEFKSKQKYWKFLSSQTIDCMESTSYYSLPNVFTHRANHVRHRLNPYFDSMDFKTKFKECREFWERLSTQYSSNDSLRIVQKASSEPDSGFEHSEAFETRSTSPSDLDVKEFDHSVFHERQVFWEKLNKHDINQFKHEHRFIKQMSLCTLNNKSKECNRAQFVNRSCKEKCFFNEVPLTNDDRNLTDDFKSLGGTRENMRIRFYKNKDFFRSLEGLTE